jgi:hypothetical protein
MRMLITGLGQYVDFALNGVKMRCSNTIFMFIENNYSENEVIFLLLRR